ncbi:uncharacterized protein LOC114937030 [Nylanderia fulva]|uniref:uncharacterized protein LOC114937030 n=1 Tax=Nylanderia fulva TaxID=613905 RepID=UPI0010FBB316|nr:uncharacterized protein LOC114937030 [Nylanderia fulva]
MSYNQKLYQWKTECILKINEYNAKINQKQAVIAAAVVATVYTSIKRKYKKKRYWIAEVYKQRRRIGFYYLVFPMLKLDDLRFKNYFRMNCTQFEELLALIAPRIHRQYAIRELIETEQRFIICLRYLASGDSMASMSHQYSVSQTVVSQIIRETCEVIWDTLYPLVLPLHTHKEWREIANEMNIKWQFPHCIGAMDGKHVIIQSPQHSGSAYYNYKKSFSIVLLAICDANYVFTYVDIGAYGRQSDSGVFKNSLMGQKFAQGQMNVPPAEEIYEGSSKYPYVLVADEAFH